MVNVDEAIIAKYEYCGEHFEILVDADLAASIETLTVVMLPLKIS